MHSALQPFDFCADFVEAFLFCAASPGLLHCLVNLQKSFRALKRERERERERGRIADKKDFIRISQNKPL
jgi:hypothetical protein